MKNNISFLILLLMSPAFTYGQFKVFSNGRITVESTATTPAARINIGESLNAHNYNMGVSSCLVPENTDWNIGVFGSAAKTPAVQGRTCGVMGLADNGSQGVNYGVYGIIGGQKNGAAVLGSIGIFNDILWHKYAGYFNGTTRVVGSLTANSFNTPSDGGLILNVQPLTDRGSSLDKVLRMNTVSFNYKGKETADVADDTSLPFDTATPETDVYAIRHYGLIAQELQDICPELVNKGEDGYLEVNYVELIPVLISSIQELKAKVDILEGLSNASVAKSPMTTGISGAAVSDNVLYQNTPNPFKEQTVIRFRLAENVQDASICIFDMTGKQLKKLPISPGMDSVSVGGYELGEGMFIYSLIVNGQVIDTRRMAILK